MHGSAVHRNGGIAFRARFFTEEGMTDMKISTRGRYALRIMTDLAVNDTGEYIRLKEISERQDISLKYLEQIMPVLTKAGFVKSFRGNNGGYRLTCKPEEYIVGDIIRCAEGTLAPIACLEDSPNQCPRCGECITLPFWTGLQKVVDEYVDSYTLADLLPAHYYAEGI